MKYPFLPSPNPIINALTDNQSLVTAEVVLWNLEVEWCWASADTARDVVVGAVAWAEPSSEVAGLADWDTSQVCADTCVAR